MTLSLGFYKTHPDVILPNFSTKQSACFDIAYQGHGKNSYDGYNETNKKFSRPTPKGQVFINSQERVLVPTGLILDIPVGYSVRLHARSGLSIKNGIILANSEAVIDSDYVDELFVLLYNRSSVGLWISTGDRIAQGELVKQESYTMKEVKKKPVQKSDRKGGMGSTGVKNATAA